MKLPREIRSIDIEDIHVGERQRALREDGVKALAASMKEIGLMTPISIRIVDGPLQIDGEEVWSVPCLIAGAHRLAAAKASGWAKIDCYVLAADDIDAQLWEVDENLSRAELTTDEKRTQLRLRKQLWEKRQETGGTSRPTSLSDGRSAGPQHQRSFAAETSAATGMSKRQINRLIADPKPPAPKIISTGVEKVLGVDASESRLKAAQNAYNRLNDEERNAFLEWLEENEPAIFDTTTAGRAA